MKTKLICNVKFLSTLIIALSLNTLAFAQPSPEKNVTPSVSVTKLMDELMIDTESSLKYQAPDEIYSESATAEALFQLNIIAAKAEGTLKYKAPQEIENEAIQDLELLAQSVIEDLKYQAPDRIECAQKVADNIAMTSVERKHVPVKVEVCTPQDEWLINAGYIKSERTPVWDKVKKSWNARSNDKAFADSY